MRMLLTAHIPHEPFNSLVRDGKAGKKIQKILAAQKPEAVYFTEQNGSRTALLVINLEKASDLPKFAEPWFLSFEADVEVRVAMTPDDLAAAGLDSLGAKWK